MVSISYEKHEKRVDTNQFLSTRTEDLKGDNPVTVSVIWILMSRSGCVLYFHVGLGLLNKEAGARSILHNPPHPTMEGEKVNTNATFPLTARAAAFGSFILNKANLKLQANFFLLLMYCLPLLVLYCENCTKLRIKNWQDSLLITDEKGCFHVQIFRHKLS